MLTRCNLQASPGITTSETVDLKPMVHGGPMNGAGKVNFVTEIKLPEGLTHLTSLGHGDNVGELKVDR